MYYFAHCLGVLTHEISHSQPSLTQPKNKGKGKARSSLVPSADVGDLSEGGIVSEPELEYDENASIEESDNSGSEFEVSDESVVESEQEQDDEEQFAVKPRKSPRKQTLSVMDQEFVDDSDADEIMMDAAIQESLQSARQDKSNGAGPSSRANASSNAAAALRAAAAEKRLARQNQSVDVDDFDLAISTDSDDSDNEASSKSKSKGKMMTSKKFDTTSTKFMSLSERRRLNREERKLKAASNRENRKEELAMIKELGRRLTYVRYSN